MLYNGYNLYFTFIVKKQFYNISWFKVIQKNARLLRVFYRFLWHSITLIRYVSH